MLRLVKGLGMLGPEYKMTAKAAEALIRRFGEPLANDDINVIAKLTRLSSKGLHVALGLAGPYVAAEEAIV
ncbi:Cytochrome P450 71D8 [Hordeum vulgare]|nr:Cytochrome P450 71D8 [Hordeum vulgare]